MIKKIILVTVAVFSLSQTKAQTLLKENKLRKENDGNYVKTDAVSGEVYTNNINKIVFSKQKIDPKGSSSQLTTEFNLGEPIKACILLPTSLYNYLAYDAVNSKKEESKLITEIMVFAYIDNKDAYDFDAAKVNWDRKPEGDETKKYSLDNRSINGDNKSFPFINFELNKSSNGGALSMAFINALNKLSIGKHTIYINVLGVNSTGSYLVKYPIARGEFTIVKGDNAELKLGRKFGDIKSWMTDPALEAKALKMMKEYQATTGAVQFSKPNLTADKVKFVGNDWVIIKHAYNGYPEARMLPCAVPCKHPDGGCVVMVIGLIQTFDGKNYQSNFSSAVNLDLLDYPNVPRRID